MNRSLVISTARGLKRLKKKKKNEGRKEGRGGGREEGRKGSMPLLQTQGKKLVRRKEIDKSKRSEALLLHHTWGNEPLPEPLEQGDCMRSGSPPFRATIQIICLYDFPFSAEIYNLFVFFLLVSSYTLCHITSGSLKTQCHLLHWMTDCSLRGSFRVSQSEFCE